MQDFEIILVKSSLENGLIFLYQYANDSQVIAGGTTLVPQLQRSGVAKPYLVDFSEIRSVAGIIKKNAFVRIGAMTPLRDLLTNELILKECGLIAEGVKKIKNRQIINRATIGGAVASSSLFSDVVTALVAYDAKVAVISKTSKRKIELREMIVSHNKNILQPFEMVGYIEIEVFNGLHKNFYLKAGTHHDSPRNQMALAVNLIMEKDGETVQQARISPGNIYPRPRRIPALEEMLRGKKYSWDLVLAVGEASKKGVNAVIHPLDTLDSRQKLFQGAMIQALHEVFQKDVENVG